MNHFGFLFCVFIFQFTFAQTANEKLIHGKIIVASGNAEGVNIVNLVNEKSTVSDANGDFYILAKAEDLLVFSAINLEYHRQLIEEENVKSTILTVKMDSKTTELKEVIVNEHPEINAVSLGISPKGVKHYTPAERRLFTAGDFKPIQLLGILGGSLPVDPILNAINGRTAMLKKGVEVEKKELLLERLEAQFDDKYYIETLKISKEYIKGFQYYCIENANFVMSLKSKNKSMTMFLIIPLAEKYNQTIKNEN